MTLLAILAIFFLLSLFASRYMVPLYGILWLMAGSLAITTAELVQPGTTLHRGLPGWDKSITTNLWWFGLCLVVGTVIGFAIRLRRQFR